MADNLFVVSRSAGVGIRTVNGVQAVLITKDSADADAVVIAAAVSQCNAGYAGTNSTLPFDAKYFDTVLNVTDLTSGAMKDINDTLIFANDAAPKKVEG